MLYNTINTFRDKEAEEGKHHQASRYPPKPIEILDVLAGDLHVHAPHACDDVHREHNGTEHSQLAKHVVGALGSLVHSDADLREVV